MCCSGHFLSPSFSDECLRAIFLPLPLPGQKQIQKSQEPKRKTGIEQVFLLPKAEKAGIQECRVEEGQRVIRVFPGAGEEVPLLG